MDLVDHAKVKDDFARVEEALLSRRRVLVVGPTGSGRGRVLAALRLRQDVIAVEAPPLSDADAPVHPLLTAAACVDRAAIDLVADGRKLEVRAADLADRIASLNKILVLRLPASWRAIAPAAGADPDRQLLVDRARLMLKGLASNQHLRLVILADPGLRLDAFCDAAFWNVKLRPMHADLDAVADNPSWGAYAPHAHAFASAAHDAKVEMTPVQARLAVGLVGLGVRMSQVIGAVQFPGAVSSSLEILERRLVEALRREPQVAAGVVRVALARYGLPRSEAISISQLPAEQAPLVTECLAYGTDTVAMHDRVRTALASFAAEGLDREGAHHNLADYHRTLDGTGAVTDSPSPRDWLERAFHLGLSGDRGAAEWKQLTIPSREIYWTRGRALSLAHQYEAAAVVYHECAARFPDDDYASHYEAFNRDRAGIGDAATETAFRRAISIAPTNAWWNTRLVTFLVERARFLAARSEWVKAMERVDPDGEGGTWLALHFHRWVVKAWLSAGEVELAREAFDAIPDDALRDDTKLAELAQHLGDAEEARALGQTVYPANIPLEDRWTKPMLLPETSSSGAHRRGWYPARVVDANDEKVLLVIGLPPAPGEEPRVALKEMLTPSWRKAARATGRPAGFWEIGSYEGDETQALPMPPAPKSSFEHDRDPLRFMRRWTSQSSS